MSKPIWQRKTIFSNTRNVSVVIWPETEGRDGHTFPPNIILQEGKNEGTSENPKWSNRTIRLTVDKLPRLILDLQFAYNLLIQLESNGASNTAASPPKADYDLAGRIYKTVCAEQRISAAAVTLANRFSSSGDEVTAAVEKLQKEGLVKFEIDGLEPYLVLIPR